MPTFPPRHRLPTAYSTEIGKIISRWAYVEWRLKSIVYVLLMIDPKQGRVVVPQASAVGAFQMVQELLPLRGIKPSLDLKAIKEQLENIEEFRNAVAHGVWLKHDQTVLPTLQITRKLKLFLGFGAGLPKTAKVDPRPLPLKLETLREVVIKIDKVAKFCDQLFDGISSALAAAKSQRAKQ